MPEGPHPAKPLRLERAFVTISAGRDDEVRSSPSTRSFGDTARSPFGRHAIAFREKAEECDITLPEDNARIIGAFLGCAYTSVVLTDPPAHLGREATDEQTRDLCRLSVFPKVTQNGDCCDAVIHAILKLVTAKDNNGE